MSRKFAILVLIGASLALAGCTSAPVAGPTKTVTSTVTQSAAGSTVYGSAPSTTVNDVVETSIDTPSYSPPPTTPPPTLPVIAPNQVRNTTMVDQSRRFEITFPIIDAPKSKLAALPDRVVNKGSFISGSLTVSTYAPTQKGENVPGGHYILIEDNLWRAPGGIAYCDAKDAACIFDRKLSDEEYGLIIYPVTATSAAAAFKQVDAYCLGAGPVIVGNRLDCYGDKVFQYLYIYAPGVVYVVGGNGPSAKTVADSFHLGPN